MFHIIQCLCRNTQPLEAGNFGKHTNQVYLSDSGIWLILSWFFTFKWLLIILYTYSHNMLSVYI